MTDLDPIRGALTREQADAVFDLLAAEDQVPEPWRDMFVHHQTTDHCTEYRFQGTLGFGGKFWRANDRWYVTAYPEDIQARPERQQTIDRINEALGDALLRLAEQENR